MKHLLRLFIVACFNCCSGQGTQNELAPKLPPYKTFYWANNSELEFHAINFDSAMCNLFSFGPGQLNSREKLKVVSQNNVLTLIDTLTGKRKNTIQFSGDTAVFLQSLTSKGRRYKMISNAKCEKLFNLLKAKYSFECFQSNQIAYNGITPDLTNVEDFLNDGRYKQTTETFQDEIYGKDTQTYLEFNGNRFYYIQKKGPRLFDKIEIRSNDISSFFLDIKIGDTFDEVQNKLKSKVHPYRVGNSDLKVRICNSRYVGRFGALTFKFRKQEPGNLLILKEIIYQPLIESE